jgi:membrane-bound inhibitor of C-type lysozyme
MKPEFKPIILVLTGLPLLIGGCSSVNVWPFGGDSKTGSSSRVPENATEYRCEGNKTFYVRYPDGGKSAWVILPDRQVSLDKVAADSGSRYSNGIAVLRIDGTDVSLTDGPSISYRGCNPPTASSKP